MQISTQARNGITTGSDGGLYFFQPPPWFDAVFTLELGYNAMVDVPEVGSGWQQLPIPSVLDGQVGNVKAHLIFQDGCAVLQPGTYYGNGVFREYGVPPGGSHVNYLYVSPLDTSNGKQYPVGPAISPISDGGTNRLQAGPLSFPVSKPSKLMWLFTPYGASWHIDAQFQIFAASVVGI